MPFNVIRLDTGATVNNCLDGTPLVYATGKEAADAAKSFSESSLVKHQPRRIAGAEGVDWRGRERARFASGAYQAVPWASEWWVQERTSYWDTVKDHFAHVSTEEPGKLAFTVSDEHGTQDRQTRMRPGKYLQTYFSRMLTEYAVRAWAGRFAQDHEQTLVKFASSADDIERVYLEGPDSCMSHAASTYSSSMHPVRVYAAGDLAIAYLEADNADGEDSEGVTARCVCWPERKVYTRIYGDETRLGHALDALGYTHKDKALVGAKLLREEEDGRYVVPYIDHIGHCLDDGEHLILGRGDIDCQQTDGVSGEIGEICDCCGGRYDSDSEGGYLESRCASVCASCYSENTFYCDATQASCEGDSVSMANGDTWCQEHFDSHGATCEATDENHRNADCVTLENGTVWSKAFFATHGYICRSCHCLYENGDACSNSCDPEAAASLLPLQGRDEHPDQIELTLEAA